MKISNGKTNIGYKAISFTLNLVLLLVTIMTGTLAWEDFSQHKTNEFSSENRSFAVVLNKFVRDIDGEETTSIIEGAEFYLYKVSEDEAKDVQIGTRFVTDTVGQIVVEDLEAGDYYFLETNPTYGYTYDTKDGEKKDKYEFTVSDTIVNSNDIFVIDVYNQKRCADLKIVKKVLGFNGAELSEEEKNTPFEFVVTFSDGGTYKYSISGSDMKSDIASGGMLYLKHGQTATIENLPVGLGYRVIETPTNDYAITSSNHQENMPIEGITTEFTNTAQKNILTADSLIISNVILGDAANKNQEFKFTITFSDDGEYTYFIGDEEKTVKSGEQIILKDGQEAVFPELPIGLVYTVKAEDYAGYIVSIKKMNGVVIADGAVLGFKYYKIEDLNKTGSLSIGKKVFGSGADETKKFDFTVEFKDKNGVVIPANTYKYRVNGGALKTPTNDSKITLKHNETAVFEGLPVGTSYTITEDDYSTDGYTGNIVAIAGTIVEGDDAKVNFTNENQSSELIVKKKVVGKVSDVEFKFTVTIDDGEPVEFTLKHGEQKIFNVPYGAIYEVFEEDCFNDGYLQSSMSNGYGTAAGKPIIAEKTNTFIRTIFTEISGIKTWDISTKPDIQLPNSITIELKNKDTIVDVKTINADENGEWKYTFVAPLTDENEEEIEYTVNEIDIPNYISTVSKTEEVFTITNKYVAPAKGDPPIVKKTITGDTPVAMSEFAFKMSALDDAPMPQGSLGTTKIMSITGEGEVEFGYIEFKTPGTYVYTLSETLGDAKGYIYDNTVYTLTYVVEEVDGVLVVSRTYTKVGEIGTFDNALFNNVYSEDKTTLEYTSVSVTKEWVGNDVNQPSNVQAQIYQNGIAYGDRIIITAENNWQYTWLELDKDAVWTVDEINVPSNYTKTITGSAENGFIITNTYKEDAINPSVPGVPPTADTTNVWTWFRMMLISMFILRYTMYREVKALLKARGR